MLKKNRVGRDEYELDCSPKVSSCDAILIVSQQGQNQVGLEERGAVPEEEDAAEGL